MIALALGSATGADARRAAPPAPPPTGTIELFQSSDRVLVMMRVGEGELVPMVFDTGSDGHSFDRLIVARDRLKRVGRTTELDGTTGKRRSLPRYAIPDVALGGLRVGRIEGVGLDYDRDDAMGIISPEMFADRLVTLELGRNRARVIARTEADIPIGPATPHRDHLPAIPVTLPGGRADLGELDTGYNGAISLPVAMMKTILLRDPPTVVGHFQSIDTSGEVYGGRVRGTITVGPIVLVDPDVVFLGDTINIGLPLIRRLTVVLDPAGQRSWAFDCKTGVKPTC